LCPEIWHLQHGNPRDELSVTTQYEDLCFQQVKHQRRKKNQVNKHLRTKITELRPSLLQSKNIVASTSNVPEKLASTEILESGISVLGENDIISVSSHYSNSVSAAFDLNHKGPHWNHSKHIFVAMHIAPVLFIANWLFNASLQATTVTSSTVLVSTSGIFVFVLAVLVRDESFQWLKLVGALLGIFGSLLTARHDTSLHDQYDAHAYYDDAQYDCIVNNCNSNVWGDTLAILAAAAFGVYAVQVRLLCPLDEELYSMGLLLGYIGVLTMIPLLPVAFILAMKVQMTWEILILIAVRGLFDYVISEYLHFRAVILTNATIATVGLGLTIPMAFAADIAMSKNQSIVDIQSLLGALAVSAGFMLVNVVDDKKESILPSDTIRTLVDTVPNAEMISSIPSVQERTQLPPILESDVYRIL
jgi:solute carrier family 35 protein F5